MRGSAGQLRAQHGRHGLRKELWAAGACNCTYAPRLLSAQSPHAFGAWNSPISRHL